MTADLETLLTALYVLIDDHVIPSGQPRAGGRRNCPTRSWCAWRWRRCCWAPGPSTTGCGCATGGWGTCFPNLPHQPGYHKRVKAAAPLICTATRYLASLCPSQDGQLRLLDATPVPCATSRQTVRRSELAGWANYGYCAAHSRWYWGLKLYLLATPEGMPVTWCLADPKIGEREVAAELLDHAAHCGALHPGMIVLADKGLAGREMERYAADQARVLLARPDRKDEKRRFGNLAGMRQWIEAIFGTLKDQLSLERHGNRTPAGIYARTAQRMLALAAAIWHNYQTGAADKRSLIAYDH